MTFESLKEGIKRLILRRQELKDQNEIDLINKKLTKLYDLKYLMMQQMNSNI